jgi:hypothetical protein
MMRDDDLGVERLQGPDCKVLRQNKGRVSCYELRLD